MVDDSTVELPKRNNGYSNFSSSTRKASPNACQLVINTNYAVLAASCTDDHDAAADDHDDTNGDDICL